MKNIIDTLRPRINPRAMLDTAGRVSGYHRIQASPGYRAAAQYCLNRLQGYGIETRILSYPADGVQRERTDRTLREWDIQSGGCHIDGFGEIADYGKAPLSVIVRSTPCDFRQDGLEVVYLDKSAGESDYEGVDLTGKLAFVRGNINDYAWVCQKRGGLGLITDFVLHPDTQQTVLRYTSYWWKEIPGEIKYFGFCLSPKQGKALAEHCLRARESGTPVMARGWVEAAFADGFIEVVEAVLPGTAAEEVLVTAHLCHPQSSSNDNASGVAAAIEALRAIKAAVEDGALPPLKRGIRLLLIPEMSGTAAWLRGLNPGEIGRFVAGINLDMVGGRQDPGTGPLVLTSLPRSTPSFTEYAAMLALETAACTYSGFDPNVALPAVSHAVAPFTGGSDHYILSDPTVGVPCTMLGQWPDTYYHTSGDTMDRLSPETLRASCAATAGFCVRLSTLTAADLPALFTRGKVHFARELAALAAPGADGPAPALLLEAYRAAFGDARRLLPGDRAAEALILAGQEALGAIFAGFCAEHTPHFPQADQRVPVRQWQQPIHNMDQAARWADKSDALAAYEQGPQKQFREAYLVECLCYYYMDGRRTVDEILARVAADTGQDTAPLRDYITLLEQLGLVVFA